VGLPVRSDELGSCRHRPPISYRERPVIGGAFSPPPRLDNGTQKDRRLFAVHRATSLLENRDYITRITAERGRP
jgi:hypothetical protein